MESLPKVTSLPGKAVLSISLWTHLVQELDHRELSPAPWRSVVRARGQGSVPCGGNNLGQVSLLHVPEGKKNDNKMGDFNP